MGKSAAIILFLAFMSACASPPKIRPPTDPNEDRSARDQPFKVDFIFRTSESANILDILDCTSNFMEGFCGDEGAYRAEWEKPGPLSPKSKEALQTWAGIRRKYYYDPDQDEKDPRKNRNGFFSTLGAIDADPVASAFYRATRVEDATGLLEDELTSFERHDLQKSVQTLRPGMEGFLFESSAFDMLAEQTAQRLRRPDYFTFLKEIAKFYGVGGSLTYTVIWNWWPPLKRDNATPTGSFLVIRKNPRTQLNWTDDDIIFHEIVHTISARQPLTRKRALTEAFLDECYPGSIRKSRILEEPLAVAVGQMIYLKRFFPKRFESEKNWYADPWVDRFARGLFPLVEEYFSAHRELDVGFAKRAGEICRKIRS